MIPSSPAQDPQRDFWFVANGTPTLFINGEVDKRVRSRRTRGSTWRSRSRKSRRKWFSAASPSDVLSAQHRVAESPHL